MKHIIILGDGMADHPPARQGGETGLRRYKRYKEYAVIKKIICKKIK